MNDAESGQAPSAQPRRRHSIPRRNTFSGPNNRSSERRCSNEFMATKDATRRDRAKRRDDFAMEVVSDARRETKTATFVEETTSQRNVHARRRAANERPIHDQITTKSDQRRQRRKTDELRTNRSADRARIVCMDDPTNDNVDRSRPMRLPFSRTVTATPVQHFVRAIRRLCAGLEAMRQCLFCW